MIESHLQKDYHRLGIDTTAHVLGSMTIPIMRLPEAMSRIVH